MAAMMGGERSRTLHNFSLPPRLSWGTQKLLRCSNNNNPSSSSQNDAGPFPQAKRPRNSSYHEKLMFDLRSEVDKMRAAFIGDSAEVSPSWNLRTRKEPPSSPPVRQFRQEVPPPPSKGEGVREKFSVALTRQEIEDDFLEMLGRRPPRKPKKRPRYVQKQLDTLFPGLWLSEITADMYKVNEAPDPAK